ncbi:hypothetical protein [Halobacillus hunanensis]|uniref:hypothetical protein n=1 Tax=Halobacillus hunanensis TaxID=578214 RepID=UPI0011164790|nr:hypothetical protein [Halobacillus hunanensis]
MSNCGFSERTFEFCFNAEFSKKYKGILATYPFLPSQRQEKLLGYDVNFELEYGNYRQSLFLQHKIPNFAQNRQHNNRHFYDEHHGPYYRFGVNTFQHNRMISLSSGRDYFYCAPLFSTRNDLQIRYGAQNIVDSSIWIDLNGSNITDNAKHNITYSQYGTKAILHSKTFPLKPFKPVVDSNIQRRRIDKEYVHNLKNDLSEQLVGTPYQRKLSSMGQMNDLDTVQYILSHILSTSWILLP